MPRRLGIAGLLTLFIGAGSAQEIQWEGYGTVAAHRGDDAVAGVRADGRNRHFSRDGDWVFDGDSLLAVQAQASHPRLGKLVWQALARDDVRHGLRPRTEWLYWSQETESGWQWRLGRTALPIFLHSETRHLGYAQTTARAGQCGLPDQPLHACGRGADQPPSRLRAWRTQDRCVLGQGQAGCASR